MGSEQWDAGTSLGDATADRVLDEMLTNLTYCCQKAGNPLTGESFYSELGRFRESGVSFHRIS